MRADSCSAALGRDGDEAEVDPAPAVSSLDLASAALAPGMSPLLLRKTARRLSSPGSVSSSAVTDSNSIARALANDPEVLLMDEPFGALDAQTKEQMQVFFHDLWEKTQLSVLMITHDIEEAIFLSQRVHIMGKSGSLSETIDIQLLEHRELDLKLTTDFINYKRHIVQALR